MNNELIDRKASLGWKNANNVSKRHNTAKKTLRGRTFLMGQNCAAGEPLGGAKNALSCLLPNYFLQKNKKIQAKIKRADMRFRIGGNGGNKNSERVEAPTQLQTAESPVIDQSCRSINQSTLCVKGACHDGTLKNLRLIKRKGEKTPFTPKQRSFRRSRHATISPRLSGRLGGRATGHHRSDPNRTAKDSPETAAKTAPLLGPTEKINFRIASP